MAQLTQDFTKSYRGHLKVMSRRDLGFWTAAARNSCEGCSSPFLGLSLDAFGTRVAAAITDGWRTGSLWHGIRATVITDNGPQFACLEFAQLDCTLYHWNLNILPPACAPKSNSRKRRGHSFPSTQEADLGHDFSETIALP